MLCHTRKLMVTTHVLERLYRILLDCSVQMLHGVGILSGLGTSLNHTLADVVKHVTQQTN